MNLPIESTSKVLLICPVRNEEVFIPKLLLSLQRQSHANWTILFFDNASTDATAQLISRASQKDVRIILESFEEMVPINENFNRAIQIAVSKYPAHFIGFIGGDDMFFEETYIEDLVFALNTNSSIAIPVFKIQEQEEVDSYFATYKHLNKIPIINRIMQAWDSNYGNILYSLFRWDDFQNLVSDRRSTLTSNLSSDWWFVNTALRVIKYPPLFVPTATYIKFNKRISYDSEYYHVEAPHSKGIGLQSNQSVKLREKGSTLGKRTRVRIENILVVPTLIIFREWKRIYVKNYPEFILVWFIMIATRIRTAYKSYPPKS